MKAFNTADDCPLCEGTGGYAYDENHGTTCKLCCPHPSWYIQSASHPNPGEITCGACGWQARDEPWVRFDPEMTFAADTPYKILWTKRLTQTPNMPPPKRANIVRESTATFGRRRPNGQVAICENRVMMDRLRYENSTYEVDPSTVVAVMRVL